MKAEDVLEHRRQEARRICQERGLAVVPYGSGAAAWIRGAGVDLVLADLAWMQVSDLKPRRTTYER